MSGQEDEQTQEPRGFEHVIHFIISVLWQLRLNFAQGAYTDFNNCTRGLGDNGRAPDVIDNALPQVYNLLL